MLSRLKESFPKPWCLGVDFNEVPSIVERIGCLRRSRGMNDFNRFINNLELMDMPMLGRQYTWGNSRHWSRIDRFLVNPEWLEWFKLKVWGLPRLLSDHCPIVLMEDDRDWGPKPFRFISAWVLHPLFLKEIQKVGKNTQLDGWTGYIIMAKLRSLKLALKKWNSEVFGNIESQIKDAESELHTIDLQAKSRPLN